MLEDELKAAAERTAPPVPSDLAEVVLARLDEPDRTLRRLAEAVALAVTLVSLGLSPQVRAFAADLLGVAGIEVTDEEPDASPVPQQPLPSTRVSDLDRAAEAAAFPLSAPAALGEPEQVRVADAGRVVTMTWREGTVVLDQFEGAFGPVFGKQVGGLDLVEVDLGGAPGWWIPGPHDLVYVDGGNEVVSATARLAGQTLIWDGDDGVTFRLEGIDLTRRQAVEIARSLTGTS